MLNFSPFYARVTSNAYQQIQINDIVAVIGYDSTNTSRYHCRNSFSEEAFINIDDLDKINLNPSMTSSIVMSVADYTSTEIDDLQFSKYSLILIEKNIDDSWATGYVLSDQGKRLGKEGMFPLTYVTKLISIKEFENDENEYEEVPCETDNRVVFRDPTTLETNNEERGKAKSLYDFEKRSPNELTICAGDEIEIEKEIDDDWYYGLNKRTGERGAIPKNYVTKENVENENVYENFQEKLSSTTSSDSREYGLASVLYDYTAQYDDELTVLKGYSLKVIEFCGDDWVKCQNPKTEEIGIVPVAFVQIYSDDNYGLENMEDNYTTEGVSYGHEDYSTESQPGSLYPSLQESIKEEKIDFTIGGSLFPKKQEEPLEYGQNNRYSVQQSNYEFETPYSFSSQSSSSQSYPIPKQNIEWVQFPELSKITKTGNKTTPERPPPPNILGSLKPSRAAPPRPQKLPGVKSDTKISKDPYVNNNGSLVVSQKTPTSISSIIEELISSEIEYSTFLEMWESTINQANELTTKEKENLLTGYSQLKLLSKYLVEAFVEEQSKDEKDQKIGYVFIRFKDKFFQAYTSHCGALESIAETIEEESDSGLRQKLSLIVDEMRLSGKNIFDVTSAVTRPIQRAMKYILYLDQLYKLTPPGHPDYKNLFKAKETMTYLSKNLNDTKRKSEITKKYIDDKPITILERLSRLNMHSVAKKSSRFKYRISSNLGLNKIKDHEFSKLVMMLKDANSRLLKFLYHLQLYRKSMKDDAKKFVSEYTKGEYRMAINDGLWETYLELTTSILIKMAEYIHSIDQEIGQNASTLSARDYGRLIKKRNDKLADYENALNASKQLPEVSSKKAEYDALNNKLKSDLPRTIDNIYNSTTQFIRKFLSKHYDFLQAIDNNHCMLQKEKTNWKKNVNIPTFSVFVQRANKIAIFKRIEALQIGDKIDIRFKNQPLNDNNFHVLKNIPLQTDSHKNFLLSMCPNVIDKDNLRIVTKNFKNPGDNFYIKKGHIVLVIEKRGLNYFVTNGLSESVVSPDCLSTFIKKGEISSSTIKPIEYSNDKIIDIYSGPEEKQLNQQKREELPVRNELELLVDIFGDNKPENNRNNSISNSSLPPIKPDTNFKIFETNTPSLEQIQKYNIESKPSVSTSTYNPSVLNSRPRPVSHLSVGQPNKISLPKTITSVPRNDQTTYFQPTTFQQNQTQQSLQKVNKTSSITNNDNKLTKNGSEDLIDFSENLIDFFTPIETKNTNTTRNNITNIQSQLPTLYNNDINQNQPSYTTNIFNQNNLQYGFSRNVQPTSFLQNHQQITAPNYNSSLFLDEIRASINASPPSINWDAKPSDTPRIPQRPVMPYTTPRQIM
uniref:SH3 domain-containing protein n=1 Tax=Parastrongyloides trichosuri TaxID=131310 RepID=A0A0N5A3P1_PARTI